jgi:hypothetical protein
VLDKALPGLGREWGAALFGTTSNAYYGTLSYVGQFEAIAARWANEDYTFLQPTMPCWIHQLNILNNANSQTAATKQLEMCAIPCCTHAA